MGDARLAGEDQVLWAGTCNRRIRDRYSFPREGTAMRKAILVVALSAVAITLASFTRPPQVATAAPLASISHLELMRTTPSLPEGEASSTF